MLFMTLVFNKILLLFLFMDEIHAMKLLIMFFFQYCSIEILRSRYHELYYTSPWSPSGSYVCMFKLSTLTLRYMYLLAALLRMLTTMKYLNIQKSARLRERDSYFIFPVIGLYIYRIFNLLPSYFVPQNICGILKQICV